MTSARFFGWLQGAGFYREVHEQAVSLVGGGRSWLDVGTGAGLVALLAARRGFRVIGADRSPAMVEAARAAASAAGLDATFVEASLDELSARQARADVVSAASVILLAPDPAAALARCWSLVNPGGTLLIIETTPAMRPGQVWCHLRGRRAAGLLLWSLARRGRSVASVLDAFPLAPARYHPLLGGLVGAWRFSRPHLPSNHQQECP